MKKLLLSLSALCCSAAFAQIQVDTQLVHNGHMMMQDRVVIDESCITRAGCGDADDALQVWTSRYEHGYVLCKMKALDNETVTFQVTVMRTVDGDRDEVVADSMIKAAWDNDAKVEIAEINGEQWTIMLTVRQI